jgi:hypothetical protein
MKNLEQDIKNGLKKAYSSIKPNERGDDSGEFFRVMNQTKRDIKTGEMSENDDNIMDLFSQIYNDESAEIEGETKEATSAGGAGAYVGPVQSNGKEETKEATGAGSAGAYDVAFGSPRKDPLKIDNPGLKKIKEESVPPNVKGKNKKNRYGGPEGVFVKIKEKCKTFPYCNQGDINSLEFYEEDITISEKHNIYNKSMTMENLKKYIENIVEKVLNEGEIDEMEEFYEIAKKRKEDRTEAKKSKPDFLDLDRDGDKEETMKKAAKQKKETEEGAKPDFLDLDGDGNKKETMKKAVKDKKSIKLTEEEMIDLIENIFNEEKIQGTSQQEKSMKETEKNNNDNIKKVVKKMKEYNEGYSDDSESMPKTSGEISDMEKVAYEPNEEVKEYIEDFSYGSGLTGLDYDGAEPNEERQKEYLEGSSKTGNASKDEDGKALGNVVPSEVGKKFNKIREKGAFKKNQSEEGYNKDPQPVDVVKEDVDKFKKIISYNKKTQ